jgi:hypothetical protein
VALPFTDEAFLDVFGRYNALLWPAVVGLWVVTAIVVFRWLSRGLVGGRLVFALLAVHWGWSAVAYHWSFFRRINPAAAWFAVLFLVQTTIFARLLLAERGFVIADRSVRGVVGVGLVLYGLAYPLLGFLFGLQYPRLPLFAVPCPTTLITAGLLVASRQVPRFVRIVPIVWAVIGSTAAFALGIRADLALVVAGGVLAIDTLWPSVLGPRGSAVAAER